MIEIRMSLSLFKKDATKRLGLVRVGFDIFSVLSNNCFAGGSDIIPRLDSN